MERVVGLDVGTKRTGISSGYTALGIASGYTAVETKQLLSTLTQLHNEEPIAILVVGKPLQMNGEPSESMGFIEMKIQEIIQKLNLLVAWQDERFTSKMASKALVEMNARKSVRQNRSVIDEVSATLILQSYFDSRL
ncbi:MAG: Holliday junction resolvase RuvX [Flavobacteriaceae bacterium]